MDEPKVRRLEFHVDARGWLMVGSTWPMAYAYATLCQPGVVKAWHKHQFHEDRLWCVSGLARVAVAREQVAPYDKTPNGQWDVMEWTMGPLCPLEVAIPAHWWHGFSAVGNEPCVVVNCPDAPYDPTDEQRLAWDAVPFEWGEISG
jgi:dTDP-4-dehydrorhamnose 3,5-epimerase